MKPFSYPSIIFFWYLIGIISTLSITPIFADDFFEVPKQNDNKSEEKQSAFIYEPGERRLHNKCLANFNRGKKCHALLDKLCHRIQNNNIECRLLRVEQCHKNNRQHQTSAEKTCEHGSHTQPCYGIHNKCGFQEYLACKQTNYQLQYCPYYKWQYCRNKVGMENGQFKSKDCRIFHNKEMIKFYERKIRKALRWEPRGENNIAQSLAMMKTQRQHKYQQLATIKQQQESLAGLMEAVAKNLVPKLEAQQEKLKAQKRQLWNQIRQLTIQIDEYSYMGGLCKELGGY